MQSLDVPLDLAAPAADEQSTADTRSRTRMLTVIAASLTVAVGAVFRFWARSPLWLDEALTVNISRAPLADLTGLLAKDGAPPLSYALLHVWIGVFGTGDLAVRSLGGVLSLATLPVAWRAGKRIGGTRAATAMLVLLASSPYAIHYATEARMYSLVVLEVFLGFLALANLTGPTSADTSKPDTSKARSGRPIFAVGLAVATGALLLTHYWALFLLPFVAAGLAWRWWRSAAGSRARRANGLAIAALVGGGIAFLPWVPTFIVQLRHTGTPWAEPASFSAIVNAVGEFAGGRSTSGRALGLIFFALAGFGLFGAAIDNHRVEIDLRTRPRSRGVAIVTGGTLALAITVNLLTGGAFAARYAAVVFPTFLLLIVLGITALAGPRPRAAILTAAVVAGFISATGNIVTDRTQQGIVASRILADLRPGDVIAYCPDQLGPATSRLLPASVRQVTFPHGTGPTFVDWTDYQDANRAADTAAFAAQVVAQAAPTATIWFVFGIGYRTLGSSCEAIKDQLTTLRPGAQQLVTSDDERFYEHSFLFRYPPTATSP